MRTVEMSAWTVRLIDTKAERPLLPFSNSHTIPHDRASKFILYLVANWYTGPPPPLPEDTNFTFVWRNPEGLPEGCPDSCFRP